MQRSEAANEQKPRLLHELIERYASNECQEPCDHVYALYSLAGEHREHLSIDYAASTVERLVTVLDFVVTHDQLQPSRVLDFAYLLIKLFKLTREELLDEHRIFENFDLVVTATLLGTVEPLVESKASIALREVVEPLQPMPTFVLEASTQAIWVLTANEDRVNQQDQVGRQDMTYFSIAASGLHGLAACRLEQGDAICQFPETQLGFVVRQSDDSKASIIGRTYLYSAVRAPDALEPWLERPLDYSSVLKGEMQISLNLANLLELGFLGIPARFVNMDLETKKVGAVRSFISRYKTVIAMIAVAIVMLLAALLAFFCSPRNLTANAYK